MGLGKGPLELESKRVGGDQLAWKTHRKADGIHVCAAQTRHQGVRRVTVKGIALGLCIVRHLLGRGQRERCPVGGEVELQGRVRCRNHA